MTSVAAFVANRLDRLTVCEAKERHRHAGTSEALPSKGPVMPETDNPPPPDPDGGGGEIDQNPPQPPPDPDPNPPAGGN